MGNIEKYGVVALLFVIVMVVAVSIWGPKGMEVAKADPAPVTVAGDTVTGGTAATGGATNPAPGPNATEPVAKPLTTTADGPVATPIGAEPSTATPAGNYRKYKVQKGDTLEGIAFAQLGKKSKVSEILKANEGINPSRLKVGQEILLPMKEETSVAVVETPAKPKEGKTATPASSEVPKSYKTVRSDTLSDLAKKFYGSAGKWKKIYDANKSKISDPDTLPEGIELTIP